MSITQGRVTQTQYGLNFVADPNSITRNSGRQVDWDAFDDSYREGAVQIIADGISAASATALTVEATPVALPIGAVLSFGAVGSKKFAKLTAAAPKGATSLTVEALPTATADGDVAYYWTPGSRRIIKAGTAVGDLAGSGLLRPRVVTTNPAIGLLATHVVEGDLSAAATGYGVITGGVIYENLLPEATGSPKVLATAVKTELNANGTGFAFEQYGDNRS